MMWFTEYIDGDLLFDNQATLKARRKDTLSEQDLRVLLGCHWTFHCSVYHHGQSSLQMALHILFTSTRPDVLVQ